MDTVYLTDITGTLGEWLDAEFDSEVPVRVIRLLQEAYKVAVSEKEEPKVFIATHDHENDTELRYEYSCEDNTGRLTLLFHHEDSDVGEETMHYNGEEAALLELVKELLEEISEFLDRWEDHTVSEMDADLVGYYEGYTFSSLYAFNNILCDVIKKLEKK